MWNERADHAHDNLTSASPLSRVEKTEEITDTCTCAYIHTYRHVPGIGGVKFYAQI